MPRVSNHLIDVTAPNAPAILTIPEAAGALRVSRATINRLCAAGRLSAVKLPGGTRIKTATVRALIEAAEPVKYRPAA